MHTTRAAIHPHLHKQYAHDIVLRAPNGSYMPMYDDQVELSRVDAFKSTLFTIMEMKLSCYFTRFSRSCQFYVILVRR